MVGLLKFHATSGPAGGRTRTRRATRSKEGDGARSDDGGETGRGEESGVELRVDIPVTPGAVGGHQETGGEKDHSCGDGPLTAVGGEFGDRHAE